MEKYFFIAFIIIFSIWYLSYSATRLDRLHNRVETSWANLDGLLQRRAAVALEIAKSEIADPASSLLLTAAAHQARDAEMSARSQAESGLSGALGLLLNDGHLVSGSIEKDLLRELSELTDKIRIAIALHVDAVNRTQMVRRKPVFRIFRLAGRAPLPVTYEFEADVL
ncbi:hypothetical protein [Candidatus Planktophila lacus]|jgi:hypothetical protein|uniref:LemA family protein n=1 Tax=Candidatus Planktophila lacus TaxID=1884913 RepID=A0AAC9YQM5_9ACTN|nr:hypothetical protein [Candidatus Planktophila lacus]ASY10672.1 hypothetical protein A1s21148_03915 [Candidatus Planktophila lacus]